jgi:DNA polymerase V
MSAPGCTQGGACGCADADPALPAHDAALPGCSSGESFALQVLGDSMAPEFCDGEIIVIEPEGLAADGSYVLAWHADEWIFRQLRRDGECWRLHALNPAYPDAPPVSLDAVRGVVVQKATPGRRRFSKRYV